MAVNNTNEGEGQARNTKHKINISEAELQRANEMFGELGVTATEAMDAVLVRGEHLGVSSYFQQNASGIGKLQEAARTISKWARAHKERGLTAREAETARRMARHVLMSLAECESRVEASPSTFEKLIARWWPVGREQRELLGEYVDQEELDVLQGELRDYFEIPETDDSEGSEEADILSEYDETKFGTADEYAEGKKQTQQEEFAWTSALKRRVEFEEAHRLAESGSLNWRKPLKEESLRKRTQALPGKPKTDWAREQDFITWLLETVESCVNEGIPRVQFVDAMQTKLQGVALETFRAHKSGRTILPCAGDHHDWVKVAREVWATRGWAKKETQVAAGLLAGALRPSATFASGRAAIRDAELALTRMGVYAMLNQRWYDANMKDDRRCAILGFRLQRAQYHNLPIEEAIEEGRYKDLRAEILRQDAAIADSARGDGRCGRIDAVFVDAKATDPHQEDSFRSGSDSEPDWGAEYGSAINADSIVAQWRSTMWRSEAATGPSSESRAPTSE